MTITLVYDMIRWEEKELLRRAGELGLDVKVACVEKDDLEKVNGVVLQRCVSYFKALHSTALLESRGAEVHESLHTITTCGNKALTTFELQRNGVPTPKTRVVFSREQALAAFGEFGRAVLKPLYGSWGRLVAALNDRESADAILESREYMGPLHNVFYVQERLGVERDIRALVVGNEVVGAVYRYPPQSEWRSNVALGGRVEACEVTPGLEQISLRAAAAVKGGVVSIDLFEKKGGLVVNEINHRPEFRGLSAATGADVPGKILTFMGGCND